MLPRRFLERPITLGVTMIVLLVALTVGWVLLNVFGARDRPGTAAWHWTLLSVGTAFIGLLVVGVVQYLVLSVKTLNLNRRQSNFIDSVTHELKSPIASMKLYLQTLHRHEVSREQQEVFCGFMLEDLSRLDGLVDQMLVAGRLDAGRLEGETEKVALADLLKRCAEAVCLSHRMAPTTVHLALEPCTVQSRRIDLELIFRNLLDNAVKYAGPEPLVEVTLQPDPAGGALVQVADNGPGIPGNMRRKIFGRFVRLGVELERSKPGTGLGLYIVRTLVKRMRGRIRVRDRAQGPGTVFEVWVPAQS